MEQNPELLIAAHKLQNLMPEAVIGMGNKCLYVYLKKKQQVAVVNALNGFPVHTKVVGNFSFCDD